MFMSFLKGVCHKSHPQLQNFSKHCKTQIDSIEDTGYTALIRYPHTHSLNYILFYCCLF